ncbi:MAG: type I DNA topoisomerase, partial [Patescibacteria group bacterium]
GEAISYHMAVILSNKGSRITSEHIDEKRFQRITFHEITPEAIENALKNPGKINFPLVNAQQARRVLDRLVGYKLSPLIQKKLARRWLSAGRVQSVAVRLIVEREGEIAKFSKEEYWVIEADFYSSHPELVSGSLSKNEEIPGQTRNDKLIKAKLVAKEGIKYELSQTIKLFDGSYTFTKSTITDKKTVDYIITDLKSPFIISAVDKKEIKRYPAPPYTTSTLQIDAGRKLGYSAKRIMQTAQRLYEDGLITYHRTDSVNLSTKFLSAAKSFVEKEFGREYSHYRTYTTKTKLAQEAHEAIRPTEIRQKSIGSGDERDKLYDLIWKRAVASQMSEAVFDSTTIDITSANNYLFQTQGSIIKFAGFLKVTGVNGETTVLPEVIAGDTVDISRSIPEQKFTASPPRYSEASLIKSMEEDGIGRPSTYAPTISTIVERGYVEKETKEDGRKTRNFVPTPLGFLVSDFLVKYFPDIVDLAFTATIEQDLDEVAQGEREWLPLIAEFYEPFKDKIMHVEETVEKLETPVVKTGKSCPLCTQGEEIIKTGRFGKFLACTRFPECKYTKNLLEKIGVKCPECKLGEIVMRKSKRGRVFYGCERYPQCKFASWQKPKIENNLEPVARDT